MAETTEDDALSQLIKDFGYGPVLNEVKWPPIPLYIHLTYGVLLLSCGIAGSIFHIILLNLHRIYSKSLMDPSGILLVNFMISNLGLAITQCPFSGFSSIMTKWMFGPTGCQVYATIGFMFGIGSTYSIFLIIFDQYTVVTNSDLFKKRDLKRGRVYLTWIYIKWLVVFISTLGPMMGFLGRFYLEPNGTACTLDYWHGNFANYKLYSGLLVIGGFFIPAGIVTIFLVKVMSNDNSRLSKLNREHRNGMKNFCFQSLMVQMVCWTPYALMCIWTIFYEPDTLNIYLTFLPNATGKLTPFLQSMVLIANIPRIRAAFKYRNDGRELPLELNADRIHQ